MQRTTLTTRLLAATGGAVVIALAAGGVAYATTSSATAPAKPAATAAESASTATSGHARWRSWTFRRDLRTLARHTVHADLVVKTPSGYKDVEVDRGKLTSVNASSITITRPDGPTVSADINSATKFFGVPESSLATGDRVVLVQTGGNAVIIGSRPPKPSSTSTATS